MTRSATAAGTVVAGRFRLERMIGQGGMGTVHLATDLTTGGPVALKLLREEAGPEIDRFIRESELLASLGHPAIVRHVAHGIDGVRPWLAMEWLEGESLQGTLQRGPLTLTQAVAVVRAAADALGAAHERGVVHRDVKPGNLFLVGGSAHDVRVLDFGIARTLAAEARTLTTTGTVLGTAFYMAPEQARAGRDLDARVDVWALGCVLYEALSGRKPFDHESLVGVLAAVLLEEPPPLESITAAASPAVAALVREMLDKDRERRPASGAELVRRLDALEPGGGSRAPAAAGITGRERRVVCLVLARPRRETSDATARGAGWALDESAGGGEGRLRAVAEAHRARVELLADGTLVVALDESGAPSDQAARAARLALSLREAAPDVGLAALAGRAELAGRIPVGEVVDRGAKLLASPEAGTIALDDELSGLLDGRFEVEARAGGGSFLRGLAGGDATARTALGRTLPFLGRDRELTTLLSLAEESRVEPIARVALVSGAPGTGKTRIASELARRLGEAGTRVWTVRGEPLFFGAPLSIAARLVRDAARIVDGEPLETRREKLHALTRPTLGGRASPVAALLGEIARAPFDDAFDDGLRAARRDALVLGDAIRGAFAEWLFAELARGPLAILLDDLHAVDSATIGLLDAAIREASGRPFFVVGLFRPEDGLRVFEEREPQSVALGRLLPRHCRALAEAALGTIASPERVALLSERCEGNPFFLEEMARATLAGRGDTPPVSVLAVVEDRLGVLSPRARRLARAASVLGAGAVPADLAALVPDLSPSEVDGALAELEREEIVARDPSGRRCSFRQPLVREAAYAMLTDDDRRLAHRLASERVRLDAEHDPAILAEHLDAAGLAADAAVLYVRAAERALAGHDLAGAARRATRGLELAAPSERGPLLEIRARALRWLADYPAAFDDARAAVGLLPSGSAASLEASSSLFSAAAALGRGESTAAERALLLTLEVEASVAPRLVVALARAASLALATEDEHGREALHARARTLVAGPAAGDALATAWLSVIDASLALRGGDVGAFAALTEAASLAYERAGDVRDAVNQRVRLGNAWVSLGVPERAEVVLADATRAAARMGLRLVEGYAWQNLGHALHRLGRASDAHVAIERALVIASALGDTRLEAGSRLYASAIALTERRFEAALSDARRALVLSEDAGGFRAVALAAVASAAGALGDLDGATRAADEALDLLRGHPLEEGDAQVELAIALALSAAGRADESRTRARAAAARIEARAEKIADATLRTSFLERVAEHQALRAWRGHHDHGGDHAT